MFSRQIASFTNLLPSSLKCRLSRLRPAYTLVLGMGQPTVEARTIAGPVRWRVDRLTSQRFLRGTYEPYMQEALARYVQLGSTVYDVGAHAGYHTVLCSLLVGREGRVCAFEPNPQNLTSLKGQVTLNHLDNVDLYPVGLSNEQRRSRLNTSAGDSQGYLSETGNLEVEIRTVDFLVNEQGLPFPQVMKIDVEGHESEVIEGALDTIRRYRPVILCDHNDDLTLPSLRRVLEPLGYEITAGPPIVAQCPTNFSLSGVD